MKPRAFLAGALLLAVAAVLVWSGAFTPRRPVVPVTVRMYILNTLDDTVTISLSPKVAIATPAAGNSRPLGGYAVIDGDSASPGTGERRPFDGRIPGREGVVVWLHADGPGWARTIAGSPSVELIVPVTGVAGSRQVSGGQIVRIQAGSSARPSLSVSLGLRVR